MLDDPDPDAPSVTTRAPATAATIASAAIRGRGERRLGCGGGAGAHATPSGGFAHCENGSGASPIVPLSAGREGGLRSRVGPSGLRVRHRSDEGVRVGTDPFAAFERVDRGELLCRELEVE